MPDFQEILEKLKAKEHLTEDDTAFLENVLPTKNPEKINVSTQTEGKESFHIPNDMACTMLEDSDLPVCISKDGRFTWGNDAFLNMLGYTRETAEKELYGKPYLHRIIADESDPEAKQKTADAIEEAKNSGKPATILGVNQYKKSEDGTDNVTIYWITKYDPNSDQFFSFAINFSELIKKLTKKEEKALLYGQEQLAAYKEFLKLVLPTALFPHLQGKTLTLSPTVFKNASTAFVDIVGFTSKSADTPLEVLANTLMLFFEDISRLLESYPLLHWIKSIGDCLMVSTVPNGDDSNLTLLNKEKEQVQAKAALQLLQFVSDAQVLAAQFKLADQSVLLRSGINIGEIAGWLQTAPIPAFDVLGSPVNVACRLESSSEEGKIKVAKEFIDLINSLPNSPYQDKTLENISERELKGVKKAVDTFLLDPLPPSEQAKEIAKDRKEKMASYDKTTTNGALVRTLQKMATYKASQFKLRASQLLSFEKTQKLPSPPTTPKAISSDIITRRLAELGSTQAVVQEQELSSEELEKLGITLSPEQQPSKRHTLFQLYGAALVDKNTQQPTAPDSPTTPPTPGSP